MHIISLDQDSLHWAIAAAEASLARWGSAPGHYRNQWASHLVGRLGEVAAEQFFASRGLVVLSHFRFPEREALCDIELAALRFDVKTWSAAFWNDLGRCAAVNQMPVLERKADGILWCVLHENASLSKDAWLAKASVRVALRGYSTLADIRQSPVRLTGRPGMRQVRNHQVAEKDIRRLDALIPTLDQRRR
jgi:hypothetical protein